MNDRWFETLARATDLPTTDPAPAKLKSRIYSALVQQMTEEGTLLSLSDSRDDGRRLCVFEHALALAPLGEALQCRNPCRVCHARILGEHLGHAPIYWPGCPYSEFHNG